LIELTAGANGMTPNLPNLFHCKSLSNEDYFTRSLAYILNLFPRDLGDGLLQRIPALSGNTKTFLGRFESAEFIGFDLQYSDSRSKPDMLIRTSNTTLFFENKLGAPYSGDGGVHEETELGGAA
jgi:hypothetical protein